MSVLTDRKALERTYGDKCDIYAIETIKTDGLTKTVLVKVHGGLACALSQKDLRRADQTVSQNKLDYDAKLFIAPEITIAPGSKIVVTRLGREYSFKNAGGPFVYETHQEVILTQTARA